MKISDFDYNLPHDFIAQYPPEKRGESRLLVLDRPTGNLDVKGYQNFVDYLEPGDVVVLNNTRVFPARLFGKTKNNRIIEVFILEKHPGITIQNGSNWKNNSRICIIRNPKKLQSGDEISFDEILSSRIVMKKDDGTFEIEFYKKDKGTFKTDELNDRLKHLGKVPYPPYIKRDEEPMDAKRYQTIFAKYEGSVAAPTASINLTDELLKKIELKGVKIAFITLHVGYGTFKPVKSETIEEHVMHSEWFSLDKQNAGIINDAKNNGHQVWAVGTTVTRTLEYIYRKLHSEYPQDFTGNMREFVSSMSGEADVFIYPGEGFNVIDHLLTNFHAPRTTVLLLAAAFMGFDNALSRVQRIEKGKELLIKSYKFAIENQFKFLSYGDSMLII